MRLTLVFQIGHPFHGSQETVADLGHGLDELGILDRVPQCLAQLFHGSVDPMLEVNEGIVWPQSDTQLLASNDSSFGRQQQAKNLERLLLNPNRIAFGVRRSPLLRSTWNRSKRAQTEDELEVDTGTLNPCGCELYLNHLCRISFRGTDSRKSILAGLLTHTFPDSSPVHLLHTSWFTFRALCGLASNAMVQATRGEDRQTGGLQIPIPILRGHYEEQLDV